MTIFITIGKHLEQPISNPFLITGYTTRYHLLLDLDSITLSQAEGLTQLLQEQYPKLGDALIIRSSEDQTTTRLQYSKWGVPHKKRLCNSYHVVFDNVVGYNFCLYICELLADLDVLKKHDVKIRRFRKDMTLRVSPKPTVNKVKGIPKPIKFIPNNKIKRHEGMIREYLKSLQYSRNYFQGYQDVLIS